MTRLRALILALTASLATLIPTSAANAWADDAELSRAVLSDLTASQWALTAIDAPLAWTRSRGEGVTVALIDSGVAPGPEFAGRLLDSVVVSEKGKIEPLSGDELGHGTHVAGIIAAADDGSGVSGVAPAASLISIAIDDASSRSVITALRYAVASRARVVNLSLGTDADAGICKAVTEAFLAGVFVVASAGNDGDSGNQPSYPALCQHALSVGAITPRLTPALFSTFDPSVELAAPGVDVLSLLPPASEIAAESAAAVGVASISGTSQAAPVVSGIAALLLAADPSLTPAQLRERLITTAQDLDAPGWDALTGHGLPSAARALGIDTPARKPVTNLSPHLDPNRRGLFFDPIEDNWSLNWQPPYELPLFYVLHRHSPNGSSAQELTRTAVRVSLQEVLDGEWFQLEAHYADRVLLSAPLGPRFAPTSTSVRVRIKRIDTTAVSVSFKLPSPAQRWLVEMADESGDFVGARASGTDLPAGTRVTLRIKLPIKRHPQLNAGTLSALLYARTADGVVDGESRPLPPLHRIKLESAVRLSSGSARVTGSVDPAILSKCRPRRPNRLCTGDQLQLTVNGHATTARVDATGVFVAVAHVPAGTTRVRVSVRALRDRAITSASEVPMRLRG